MSIEPRFPSGWDAGPIAVVAHDAGAAEVLSSFVRQQRFECRFALEGPACAVFEQKLGPYANLPLETAIDAARGLLCGTSWQSDLELRAIQLARTAAKRSVAWLDHWVQYRERFSRAGVLVLPDELWVSDENALMLAREHLPELNAQLVDNPYFKDIRSAFANAAPLRAAAGRLAILYVCEPVRAAALHQFGDPDHWGYTEERALRYFLGNLGALGIPVDRIVIRPHPSEPSGKYHGIAAEYALPIGFSEGRPLTDEVAASDCVVGCGSMAMVIGLIGGKRVLCCIPPGGPRCPLPQTEIEMLRDLVEHRRRSEGVPQ